MSVSPQAVAATFYATYAFLITTGTITFIEAIRTQDPKVRHIMNIETVISIIAGFFYGIFVSRVHEATRAKEPLPYKDINVTRYMDWMVSTPFMLLSLCLFLGLENKRSLGFWTLLLISTLDHAMLAVGYLGEVDRMDKNVACVIGFGMMAVMFALVWWRFVGVGATRLSLGLFVFFATVWSCYGWAYLDKDEGRKNLVYNVLDLVAKCLVGLFMWLYLGGVVKL